MAGVISINPDEWTLYELNHAYVGKMKSIWFPVASQLALHANINRDTKKKPDPFEPDDFLPKSLRDNKGDDILPNSKLHFKYMKDTFTKKKDKMKKISIPNFKRKSNEKED
jgi:hypothetical protein